MFKCRACPAHTQHIESLKAEIQSLRALVHVPNTAFRIPELQLETDMVLNGAGDAIRVTPDEVAEAERINLEATRLLNGSWEEEGNA